MLESYRSLCTRGCGGQITLLCGKNNALKGQSHAIFCFKGRVSRDLLLILSQLKNDRISGEIKSSNKIDYNFVMEMFNFLGENAHRMPTCFVDVHKQN